MMVKCPPRPVIEVRFNDMFLDYVMEHSPPKEIRTTLYLTSKPCVCIFPNPPHRGIWYELEHVWIQHQDPAIPPEEGNWQPKCHTLSMGDFLTRIDEKGHRRYFMVWHVGFLEFDNTGTVIDHIRNKEEVFI